MKKVIEYREETEIEIGDSFLCLNPESKLCGRMFYISAEQGNQYLLKTLPFFDTFIMNKEDEDLNKRTMKYLGKFTKA